MRGADQLLWLYLAVQVAALSMRVCPRVPLRLVDKEEEDLIPIFLSLHYLVAEEDVRCEEGDGAVVGHHHHLTSAVPCSTIQVQI